MNSTPSSQNYQYTFYNSNSQNHNSSPKHNYSAYWESKLAQSSTTTPNVFRSTQPTIVSSKLPEPPATVVNEPLTR